MNTLNPAKQNLRKEIQTKIKDKNIILMSELDMTNTTSIRSIIGRIMKDLGWFSDQRGPHKIKYYMTKKATIHDIEALFTLESHSKTQSPA